MKKILIKSFISIAMCISLISGATYALYTDKADVNVAITSGKVDVVATVDSHSYSFANGTYQNEDGTNFQLTSGNRNIVVNGNQDGTYSIENMMPGDILDFNVKVENKSTVDVQYQVSVAIEGELSDKLQTEISTATTTLAVNGKTGWIYAREGDVIEDINVKVSLPFTTTDCQGKDATITITVSAVQGNVKVYEGPKAIMEQLSDEQIQAFKDNGKLDEDLEAAWVFKTVENEENAKLDTYGTWLADFVIWCDQDIKIGEDGVGELGLGGSYELYENGNWVTFNNGDVEIELSAGQKLPMLTMAGFALTYEGVYDYVQEFNCGIYRPYDGAMSGKTITVALCIADVDTVLAQKRAENPDFNDNDLSLSDFSEEAGTLIVVQAQSYTFE